MIDLSSLPRPEPMLGLEAYAAEKAARFAYEPRCWDNWLRYLAAPRAAQPDYLPVKLDIENVSRCNFACGMCIVSTWAKGTRARDMTLAEFKSLIDAQHGLVEIKLNGLGEALLQGDDYFEMIRYARARRIWVRMTTNASLLHLRGNAAKLIGSGVNEIDISIDGADAATFEGIRVQSDFGRVRDNCKLLNGYAQVNGHPGAKMWTLVQRANVKYLPRHVRLAAELGFKSLVFSVNLHGWANAELAARNAAVCVDAELEQDYLEVLVEIGKANGVRVAYWDVNAKFSTASPQTLCPWPFERAVVTSDSRTVPCCMIGDPDAFELGKGMSFGEAWKSDEYAAFRQAHLDGNVPQVCKGCYK